MNGTIVAVLPAKPEHYIVFADYEDDPHQVWAWAVDQEGQCWPILHPDPSDGVEPGAITERGAWWPVAPPATWECRDPFHISKRAGACPTCGRPAVEPHLVERGA